MLNTNPQERATLYEIMNHPWMTKSFNGPPDNHLPVRKPVQLPLDDEIIQKMSGFDFGRDDVIKAQLTKIIESEDYQRALRAAEKRNMQPVSETERKRGVFEFYKRKNSTTSKDTLSTPSSEAVQLGTDPMNAFHPLISVYYLALEKKEREAREANPGALAMPQSPGEKPLKVPDLPAAAYTNPQAYEMAGEKPTGGRARPRARTHGEDEIQQGVQNLNVNIAPSPSNPAIVEPPFDQQAPQPARKESTATSLLRRLSTRRGKDANERIPRSERPSQPPPSLAVFGPGETPRKSFSVRRTRERDPSATGLRPDPSHPAPNALLTPPISGDGSTDRSKKHGLGRSISVNSSDVRRRLGRRGVSEGSSMRPPMNTAISHDPKPAVDQSTIPHDAASDVEQGTTRPQAGAFASRTKSLGHARRDSMQARRARREVTQTSGVPEETDQDMKDDLEGDNTGTNSPTGFKPVYLKGFFSVSTTSSKPLHFILTDINRVLQQLGVEYIEIRGGFRCKHAPSIRTQADEGAPSGAQPLNSPTEPTSSHRRKISFGGFRNNTAERDTFRAQQPPPTPGKGRLARDPSYTDAEEEESDDDPQRPGSGAARAAGETSTHVQSDLGGSMVLKFEIFVVKVPLIALHGIQFKKIDGGTWQYKNMAQTILNDLRL